jgi:hypothetical protein
MSMQLRLPRPAVTTRLKRAGPIAAALMAALVLVPSASSGNYSDASGDAFGNAGDITAVTVAGDKGSGQVVFRITGTDLASSKSNNVYIDIDADANPLTGSQPDSGAEYDSGSTTTATGSATGTAHSGPRLRTRRYGSAETRASS